MPFTERSVRDALRNIIEQGGGHCFFVIILYKGKGMDMFEVHKKLQRLINKHTGAYDEMRVSRLEEDWGMGNDPLIPYLDDLEDYGVITFHDSSKSIFSLTSFGRRHDLF